MLKLRSSSSGLWYVGDCCGGGTAAFFCVDSSHANLLLVVGWLGALLGVWVSSDRLGLCDVPLVREEPRLKRLVIMLLPLCSSSSSDSESYSSPDSEPESEYSSCCPTPSVTGAEEPLNQFCRALILGWLALDSIAPLEGMKLAKDFVGEDALEVCCWIVDVARLKLSKMVPVNVR